MVVVMGKFYCNIQYRRLRPRFAFERVTLEGCNGDKWNAWCLACFDIHVTMWIDAGAEHVQSDICAGGNRSSCAVDRHLDPLHQETAGVDNSGISDLLRLGAETTRDGRKT